MWEQTRNVHGPEGRKVYVMHSEGEEWEMRHGRSRDRGSGLAAHDKEY